MVNNDGGVLLDQYVQPQEQATDYRTFVSGIEPKHLKHGAVSLVEAQKAAAQILTGRILVGHAVHHDLQVTAWCTVLHCIQSAGQTLFWLSQPTMAEGVSSHMCNHQ